MKITDRMAEIKQEHTALVTEYIDLLDQLSLGCEEVGEYESRPDNVIDFKPKGELQ